MVSQKNDSLNCIKCNIILDEENWNNYDKKVKHYICASCRKIQDKNRYSESYKNKQLDRFHFRKSAVIFAYGNACSQCQENEYSKLTICTNGQKITNLYDYLYNSPINNNFTLLCYNCKYNKQYLDPYAKRDKIKIISHYGGCCFSCNENNISKLKIYKNKLIKKSGISLYRWIIKNNYPNIGFRIICYNCYMFLAGFKE